ncbi:hypothetical protein L202_08452 [Cryptococcus amylolentus CBS 6039]|uniref:Methyltransferase domain-containing protein n=1 Tax=Cryptococcus amylolentus CBS 6039 TaxID=1295533 RepID=A0A1E3H9P2_9TREE|nr:hypothetical protein L202_08452 [Cryptococcus amylolentus CBS 6039]ODN73057.1 hypothetical protein L202_08452 [Cryptococcus amylolentus CBS 6039]
MRATYHDPTPLNLTPSLSHTLPPTPPTRIYSSTPQVSESGQASIPAEYERWFKTWRGRTIKKVVGGGGWCCDELELERQESEYHVLRIAQGLPFPAAVFKALNLPSSYGQPRVLEVGTGTGMRVTPWAINMADMFPHAEVIGLDTAPIQSDYAPKNCEYVIPSPFPLPPLPFPSLPFPSLPFPSFSTLTDTPPASTSPHPPPAIFTLIHLPSPASQPGHPWLKTVGDLNVFYGMLRPGGWVGVGDWLGRPFVRRDSPPFEPAGIRRGNDEKEVEEEEEAEEEAEEEVPVGTRAWYDAYDKSLRVMMGHSFDMDRLEAKLLSTEYVRREVVVPIGAHGGKQGSVGRLHLVNMRAFVESAKFVLAEYGRYSDAEIEVLSDAYLRDMEVNRMFMRYRSLWIMKRSFQ